MNSDHTCRICRGEATAQQPLIHPCKCRGSIRYIHQDCLMEWLLHLPSKSRSCDICNTPYHFRTIYHPETPRRMPASEIYTRVMTLLRRWVVRHVLITLYAACVFQMPLCWMVVGRVLTYIVDNRIPLPELTLANMLLYGAYATRSVSGKKLADMEPKEFLWTFLSKTYLRGALHMLLLVLVFFVVFLEHEWVIREEGYIKALLRRIGKQPRTKLADLLTQLADADPVGPPQAALRDLQLMQDNQGPVHDLNRAFADAELRGLFYDEIRPERANGRARFAEPANREQPVDAGQPVGADQVVEAGFHEEASGEAQQSAEDLAHDPDQFRANHQAEEAPVHPGMFHPDGSPQPQDAAPVEAPIEAPVEVPIDAPVNAPVIQEAHPDGHANHDEDEEEEELERRQNLLDDDLAAAGGIDNNGNLMALFGFHLDIVTPLEAITVVDVFILMFLFCAYLVPHLLGSLLALLVAMVVHLGTVLVQKLTKSWLPTDNQLIASTYASVRSRVPYMSVIEVVFKENFVEPVLPVLRNLISLDKFAPLLGFERLLHLLMGYAFLCTILHLFMNMLVEGNKPVMGTARKVFKLLFQITATAKVFIIFSIEIVFFPLYCGWLLDFCLAPIFAPTLVTYLENKPSYTIFLTSAFKLSSSIYSRVLLYWMWGTGYMFFIAMFVSMIRDHILRRGVLYFIKSPEDPNARLIHDAVVKPLSLQLLRIFLSAKVYTAFVVCGIGAITWGLRLFLNAPGSNGAILPVQIQNLYAPLTLALCIGVIIANKDVIAKYCKLIWKWAFAAFCHKLRLSHFILNSPISQERGRVVYRSFLHLMLQIGEPDYSKPVSHNEALEIFKSDLSVNACFVPNGSFIRAPSSDDNSRLFLKTMFIPVTKADQPLKPSEPASTEHEDWWDEDIVFEDSYIVVYSPPHLRSRALTLVCMVWVFGALITMLIMTSAVLLGRPIFKMIVFNSDFLAQLDGLSQQLSDKIAWLYADIVSLSMGLIIQVYMLVAMDQMSGTGGSPRPLPTLLRQLAYLLTAPLRSAFRLLVLNLNIYWTLAGLKSVAIMLVALYFAYPWAAALPKYSLVVELRAQLQQSPMDLLLKVLTAYWIVNAYGSLHVGPWYQVLNLYDTISTFGLITVHFLVLLAGPLFGIRFYPVLHWVMSVFIKGWIYFTRVVRHVLLKLYHINEDIKNERYVMGTAVENIDE